MMGASAQNTVSERKKEKNRMKTNFVSKERVNIPSEYIS